MIGPTRGIRGLAQRWQARRTGAWISDDTRRVVIEYTPRRDNAPDPGEVVWVWVPYEEDPTQGKDRPALVVGHERRLGAPIRSGLLVLVALTSKSHASGPNSMEYVPVGSGPWDRRHRPSFAKIEHLLRAQPGVVRRIGGQLDHEVFDRVVAALAEEHQIAAPAALTPQPNNRPRR
jgi:hypothetical protein